ncbi:uncharacterized protein NEMAJ01_1891 [Nematocida major]|uniref:uncharacterized protein n=1 Tax=Nematocida major TaxID=1912982 RepID=UPI0020078EEB|nr:uncharacterized protein NEMAJ01_1891 [Nematocida major]KAH9386995.1 hypothetical protein NEMAJ01_1891 [Nematocida major]
MSGGTPAWLLNSGNPRGGILRTILSDINGMAYHEEISRLLNEAAFITRVNYATKVAMAVFLFLRSKAIPILIEDVLVYCGCNKMGFISLLAKNRGVVINSSVSVDYVMNVLNRVHSCFKSQIKQSYEGIREKVLILYGQNYYHNKSPLTSILILCFHNNKKKVNKIVKEHYSTITTYSINKEMLRISEVLEGCEHEFENVSEDEETENEDPFYVQKERKLKNELRKKIREREKEAKIERAMNLYADKLGENTSYATDYEGLLIEGMVKQGYTKDTIMSLTYKGMEYYSPYK